MRTLRALILALPLLLGACAGVSTEIVEFDPNGKYPPTQSVEVLLQRPARPYTDLALIESRGASEVELLNDAREKAKALGADAIVKLEAERIYHAPMPVYDPWHDPFYWGRYRARSFRPFYDPWGPYHYVGGGFSYLLKSLAIRYGEAQR